MDGSPIAAPVSLAPPPTCLAAGQSVCLAVQLLSSSLPTLLDDLMMDVMISWVPADAQQQKQQLLQLCPESHRIAALQLPGLPTLGQHTLLIAPGTTVPSVELSQPLLSQFHHRTPVRSPFPCDPQSHRCRLCCCSSPGTLDLRHHLSLTLERNVANVNGMADVDFEQNRDASSILIQTFGWSKVSEAEQHEMSALVVGYFKRLNIVRLSVLLLFRLLPLRALLCNAISRRI
jgi:hypothetical protein